MDGTTVLRRVLVILVEGRLAAVKEDGSKSTFSRGLCTFYTHTAANKSWKGPGSRMMDRLS
jgi:hypothetical protein